MSRFPPSVKAEALRLVKEGATQRTVAKKLKVTDATVSRWVNRRGAAAKRATESELLSLVEVVMESQYPDAQKVTLLKALI